MENIRTAQEIGNRILDLRKEAEETLWTAKRISLQENPNVSQIKRLLEEYLLYLARMGALMNRLEFLNIDSETRSKLETAFGEEILDKATKDFASVSDVYYETERKKIDKFIKDFKYYQIRRFCKYIVGILKVKFIVDFFKGND